jgi:hypothetical protein
LKNSDLKEVDEFSTGKLCKWPSFLKVAGFYILELHKSPAQLVIKIVTVLSFTGNGQVLSCYFLYRETRSTSLCFMSYHPTSLFSLITTEGSKRKTKIWRGRS